MNGEQRAELRALVERAFSIRGPNPTDMSKMATAVSDILDALDLAENERDGYKQAMDERCDDLVSARALIERVRRTESNYCERICAVWLKAHPA